MWDHVLGFVSYAVVPATCHSAERHVAQASSSVPDPAWSPHVLTDLDTDGYLLMEVP